MAAAWFSRPDKIRRQLWLRPLDSQEARPLAGTDGAQYPFWSPDSRSVGFTAGGVLKRIDLASGLVRTLARRSFAGGAWSVDGTILIGSVIGPLYSVQADDGTVKQATNLLEGQSSHRWPQFLPDGRFLFFTLGPPDVRGVYLGSTSDANVKRVSDRESGYRFMSPAHILFAATRGAVGTETEQRFRNSRERAGACCLEGARVPRILWLRRVLLVIDRVDRLPRVGRRNAACLARSDWPSCRYRGTGRRCPNASVPLVA